MCFCGNLTAGGKEEVGKEEKVVERKIDFRTTEVAAVDGGIEEAAMITSLLVRCGVSEREDEFCVLFFASYHWYTLRHVAKALSKRHNLST